MTYTMKVTIYRRLKKATIETTIKKDKSSMAIIFDNYEVSGGYSDTHRIVFTMNGRTVGELDINLSNVLEVGAGPVTRARYVANPADFIAPKEMKRVEAGEISFEEGVQIGINRSFTDSAATEMINAIFNKE
jgi:hypothetical protein